MENDRIVEWDAGVAAWEELFDMESLDPKGGGTTNAAAVFVVDFAKGFDKVREGQGTKVHFRSL